MINSFSGNQWAWGCEPQTGWGSKMDWHIVRFCLFMGFVDQKQNNLEYYQPYPLWAISGLKSQITTLCSFQPHPSSPPTPLSTPPSLIPSSSPLLCGAWLAVPYWVDTQPKHWVPAGNFRAYWLSSWGGMEGLEENRRSMGWGLKQAHLLLIGGSL